jgi:hypothetical protein
VRVLRRVIAGAERDGAVRARTVSSTKAWRHVWSTPLIFTGAGSSCARAGAAPARTASAAGTMARARRVTP